MQMTESFATTGAAVAPVVLIAAGLETAAYQKGLQDWARSAVDFWERELRPAQALPPEERRAVVQRLALEHLPKYGVTALRSSLRLVVGLIWSGVLAGQAFATLACLVWLSNPKHPVDASTAKTVLIIIGVGIAMVALSAWYRLFYAPISPVVDYWMEQRIRDEVRRLREEESEDDETPAAT